MLYTNLRLQTVDYHLHFEKPEHAVSTVGAPIERLSTYEQKLLYKEDYDICRHSGNTIMFVSKW